MIHVNILLKSLSLKMVPVYSPKRLYLPVSLLDVTTEESNIDKSIQGKEEVLQLNTHFANVLILLTYWNGCLLYYNVLFRNC